MHAAAESSPVNATVLKPWGAGSLQAAAQQPPPTSVTFRLARKQEFHFAKHSGLFLWDLIAFCFAFVQK